MSNIQLKAGHPSQPWLVIDGTPAEIVEQIGDVFPHLIQGETSPAELPELVALAASEWATRIGAGMGAVAAQPQGVPAVQAGLGGQVVSQDPQAGPTTPAPSVSAPPAQVAPTPQAGVETDRYGNTYETGHPKAPMTPDGHKAVLKRGTSQAGKPYAQWLHPTHPNIPSAYAAGHRDKGVWTDWARGV